MIENPNEEPASADSTIRPSEVNSDDRFRFLLCKIGPHMADVLHQGSVVRIHVKRPREHFAF